jgi:hypothetical protein
MSERLNMNEDVRHFGHGSLEVRPNAYGDGVCCGDRHLRVDDHVQFDMMLQSGLARIAFLDGLYSVYVHRRGLYAFDELRRRHGVDQIEGRLPEHAQAGVDHEKADRETAIVIGG